MDSITHSTGTITPDIIDGYRGSREARTLTHTVLGKQSPDITLRRAGLRSGRLSLVFGVEDDARAAEEVLALPQVLTLVPDDRPTLGMTFVVAGGTIDTTLDDQTRDAWIVDVPFQEVQL